MKLYIKGRNNVKITDELQAHIERKVNKLDRYIDNVQEAQVELAQEPTKSASDQFVIQLTMVRNGTFLRSEERGEDFYTALDAVLEKMQQQITKFKDRRHSRHKGAPSASAPAGVPTLDQQLVPTDEAEAADAEAEEPDVVRVKRFAMKPMFRDEAIEQMELLGHNFFVFRNADTEEVNVIYRRLDGKYGLIEPTV
jgi:putative sigma-54 modulation protein